MEAPRILINEVIISPRSRHGYSVREVQAYSSQSLRSKKSFQNDYMSTENDMKSEKALVTELSSWENTIKNFSSLEIIREAKSLMERRIQHQNIAEEAINNRKKCFGKDTSPSTSLKFNTTNIRITKRLEEEKFKEKSLYYKQYEDELDKSLRNFEKKLKEINDYRESLRAEVIGMRNELNKSHEELEVCRKNLEKLEKQRKYLTVRTGTASYLSRRASIREEINQRESRYVIISEGITAEITKNTRIIDSFDQECAVLRKEIKLIKNAQIKHFRNLLLEGKDTRNEGLQWLVKKLWKLDENINKTDFSSFLEEKSIDVIMQISKKSKEIEDYLARITNGSFGKSGKSYDSSSDIKSIQTRIAEVSKSIRIKKSETIGFEGKKSIIWENLSPEDFDCKYKGMTGLMVCEQKIERLKNDIKKLQDEEIKRIFKECFLNSYDEKKKIDIKVLIAALVGVDNLDKYSTFVIKLKRDFMSKLSSTKTFNFSSGSKTDRYKV
ncbi:hypothetical protein SteCoe_34020 [Stentor coeruleus]|uniref:Uncharacterized protein n=1 Tax=Stentor coeruleus TaxID=5963 RepID=A0A1R2AVE9_9CILI|nr:hypothetical protein SteCoe_34020 [Stentor coeruleus]